VFELQRAGRKKGERTEGGKKIWRQKEEARTKAMGVVLEQREEDGVGSVRGVGRYT